MHVIPARVAARLLTVPVAAGLLLAAPAQARADEVAPATATTTASAPASAPATLAAAAPASAPAPVQVKTAAQLKAAAKAARAARIKKLGRKVIKAARTRVGKPYRFGATGPNAFDCSGLTRWAFRAIGKKLPRTSGAQAGAVKRVRTPQPGDLVFFTNGRRVYHVGIYVGKNRVLHASRPGTPVGVTRIWTRSVFYGRAA